MGLASDPTARSNEDAWRAAARDYRERFWAFRRADTGRELEREVSRLRGSFISWGGPEPERVKAVRGDVVYRSSLLAFARVYAPDLERYVERVLSRRVAGVHPADPSTTPAAAGAAAADEAALLAVLAAEDLLAAAMRGLVEDDLEASMRAAGIDDDRAAEARSWAACLVPHA